MANIEVKSIKEDGSLIVKGLGVVFGGKDGDGDSFAKETDFELDLVPKKPVYYRHRGDQHLKEKIGDVMAVDVTDEGLWFEAQVNASTRYLKSIKKLIDLGAMGFSTGTAPHLIDKKESGLIEKWPIIELSLTPAPAEPRTLGIEALKEIGLALNEIEGAFKKESEDSEEEDEDTEKAESEKLVSNAEEETDDESEKTEKAESESDVTKTSEASADFEDESEETETSDENIKSENKDSENESIENKKVNVKMADERTLEERINEVMDGLTLRQKETDDNVKGLGEQIQNLLAALEGNTNVQKAGFISGTGGDSDKGVKSFSDFLMAVYRKDSKRLSSVYKSTKDLGETSGASGGYLVPEEYSTDLLKMANANNEVLRRVQTIPVSLPAGRWPVLDQYITPTAGSGQVAQAAGVKATPVDEGDTLTETEPTFEMLEWRLHKVGGYTTVDNELIDDSPMSVEALLRGLFSVAIGAKNERNILRGTGAGEPLGILESTAKVNVTPASDNTFGWADVGNMYAKFRSAGGNPVWIIHPSVWPDIMSMESTSGGAVWQANLQNGPGGGLNGVPIIVSEHLPQANNSGDVILADLSAYLLWQRSGINIDFSEHYAFLNDQGTWRFTQRIDGKPWVRYPLTLPDPQGSYQVSPFVVHND